MPATAASYRFEGFVLDPAKRLLSAPDGDFVSLTTKAFDTLLYLVEHRERVVGKDELLASVWRDRVVEENNLTQAISAVRRGLGAGAGDHRYILTLPGHGYRFVADVDIVPGEIVVRMKGRGWRDRRRLGWLAVLLVALAVASGMRILHEPQSPHAQRIAPDATLAVLPFQPLSPSPSSSDELLGLGIADTLIARIGSSTSLRVKATASSQRMLGRAMDARQAARELGADYVLDGSMQRNGELLRAGARLIRVSDGEILWTGSYDEPTTRMFALQDRIADALAGTLRQRLPSRRSATPCDGADPLAHGEYVSGLYQINRPSADRLKQALANFSRAVDRDPKCARAYAGMAFAYRALVMTGDKDPRKTFPVAKAAVQKALSIDPTLAEAYASRGFIQFWYDWDWAASEASFKQAIALNPSLAEAHIGYAHLLANLRRYDEAADQARQAVQLDPLSPLIGVLGSSFIAKAGAPDEANRIRDAVAARDPDFWILLLVRAGDAQRRGDHQTAIAFYRRGLRGCGGCAQAQAWLGAAYARSGDVEEAKRILEAMRERAREDYQPATALAAISNALGDTAQALDLLEHGYEQRDVRMTFLAADPRWDNLRDQPRFHALMQKIRLPELPTPQ